MNKNKHSNYEILNLIGYGLAKFDMQFIREFGLKTKTEFYAYFVDIGIAESKGVVKNRMDLFDPFFPNNKRKGWWQKGDAYIHRKHYIDILFGQSDVKEYSEIVKLYLKDKYNINNILLEAKPIIKSRFKKLQETGLEAELFFINNYNSIDLFKGALLEDARLYGDGYDFQVNVENNAYLAEVKGIRDECGKFRMTEKEYLRAKEYSNDYIITIVLNLNDEPKFLTIENPVKNLIFDEKIVSSNQIKEYHLRKKIC